MFSLQAGNSNVAACYIDDTSLQGFALLFNGFIIQHGDIRAWWIW
jgi:hypothetical protein